MDPRDTGDIAEVPESDRLDEDGPEDVAGGVVDLSDVYADPGEVVGGWREKLPVKDHFDHVHIHGVVE